MKIHIVQKGDSLWKISKKYGVDFNELKKLNSQLSNPDLIMPGMKIKIPSGGVPVKTDHHKVKEMPKPKEQKVEHPYVKEKPKDVVQVQDTKPKEKPNEPVPYVPPVPKVEQPVFPQVDVNYYQTNLYQPFTPPPHKKEHHHEKKEHHHEKKDHHHEKKDHHHENKDHHHEHKDHLKDEIGKGYDPFVHIPHQKEEGKELENANYPNLPNFPQMPNVGGAAVGGIAENKEHHHHHEHHDPYYGYGHYPPPLYPYPPQQQMYPVSPILPGSGLCYPVQPYYHHMPYPYPAQPYYPAYQAPFVYGENMEHHTNDHHWHHTHPNANANANVNANANQGFYPNVSNTAYGKDDCGCDDGFKQHGHHQHAAWPGVYPNPNSMAMPMAMPYGQMGAYPQQFGQPSSQVFARPDESEDD
ncbi:SafA/ExsA family spore coat assembly protein [Bacillus sp. NPDC077027]|uniref:SafA/ExsA family spore coat assembly protein n=1 Tax=Bacillus sp. NPDC077027 TaxID=3390548 RepID=UPI003D02D772